MQTISKEEAIKLLDEGHQISINTGVSAYLIDDYIITGTKEIIWITLIGSQLIRDYLVKEYYS